MLNVKKLLAGLEVLSTFIIRLWKCEWLLCGTMQGPCLDVGETLHVAFTGAGVVEVVAADAGACMRYAAACE